MSAALSADERATVARWAEGGGGRELTERVLAIATRLIEADPVAGPLFRANRATVDRMARDLAYPPGLPL